MYVYGMTKPTKKKTGGGTAVASGVVVNGRGGRFAAGEGLTDKEAAFVREYVANGGIATKASVSAGYYAPHTDGWRVMQRPAVRAAIRVEQERVVSCELASAAMSTLGGILRDTEAPASARVQASRTVLEAAGWFVRQKDASSDQKPLNEMSIEELRGLIDTTKAAMDAIKPVDGAVIDLPDNGQTGSQPALCAK